MTSIAKTLAAGVAGGLVASLAMNLFQSVSASAFGQTGSNEDPATIKAADTAKQAVTGEDVTQKHRETAGSLVHYATGVALGVGYALAVRQWPESKAGYGTAFGVGVATLLDDLAVPAFGWGPGPTETPPATHAYGLASHVVFGLALEATRRATLAAVD
ncbi:DUF1440 domain-containing protein [Sphingomonas sp. CV7422]|uniref:DUF1440 domain-containing protein n=1 Tax=Sphingomonas sp. CV7422 TaxID=3018036 RepID=UPI0022FE6EC0|nr:DUF1440 domain-containing protein [Sphingomonas sp. CV7422]